MKRLVNLIAFVGDLAWEFLPGRRFRQQYGPLVLRRFTRFCPHCGLGSTIPERDWRLIEASDEEVPCPGCENLPRLWLRSRIG